MRASRDAARSRLWQFVMEQLHVASLRAFAAASDVIVGEQAVRLEPLVDRRVVLKAHELAKMMTRRV
jgi:hypothetical protein